MGSDVKVYTTASIAQFLRAHTMREYEPSALGREMARQAADRLNALEAERDALREALEKAHQQVKDDECIMAMRTIVQALTNGGNNG